VKEGLRHLKPIDKEWDLETERVIKGKVGNADMMMTVTVVEEVE